MLQPIARSAIDEEGTALPYPPAPTSAGLYDPANEHDACGVAFVATLSGVATHEIVDQALTALRNLDHRGASGAEPDSGDGAGILTQVPDAFLRSASRVPAARQGGVRRRHGVPAGRRRRGGSRAIGRRGARREEGLQVLGWRDVPTTPSLLGSTARGVMPRFRQLFVGAAGGRSSACGLERMAFCLRKRVEREVGVYFPSLSARTLVYKGMLTTAQLEPFFPDLSDRRFVSELALVHSRFSTNTFPSWPLAHPYRLIAHNGEINTVKGNRNWMAARESQLTSDVIPGDLSRLMPVVHARRERLRVVRRGSRAACTSAAGPCRTRC